jgi:death-on-curing protein
MENIVVWLAENKISDDLLLEILHAFIEEQAFSEELKLKICKSIGVL